MLHIYGFRWVIGGGSSIDVVRDPWLSQKNNYMVEQEHNYTDSGPMYVSNFIVNNSRRWDTDKVRNFFTAEDTELILAMRIPQMEVKDRVAWTKTTNGQYTVKSGYHLWHERNVGTMNVVQSNGWNKIWKLALPHKIKIFLWRFCRNNIPVSRRLSTKGISLPITCPMCVNDAEHALHFVF